MTTRANSSRQRILDTAEGIILQKGYVGASLDEILDKSAITKGGFFYHFTGKGELARALVERSLEEDRKMFTGVLAEADTLSEDPLERVLIFLKLLADGVVGKTEVHPGCLAVAFIYEIQQFDDAMRTRLAEGIKEWRQLIATRLELVMQTRKPALTVEVEVLADMFIVAIEGGIILARVFNSNDPLYKQVMAYRDHLRLVFGAL
ncbi:MAG: TetR/AcrR family transcriptional regulator [Pseudomonadota bacterium]